MGVNIDQGGDDEIWCAVGLGNSGDGDNDGRGGQSGGFDGWKVFQADAVVFQPKYPDAITPHVLCLTYYQGPGKKRPVDVTVYPCSNGEVYVSGMLLPGVCEAPYDPDEVKPVPKYIEVLKTVVKKVASHLAEAEVKIEQAFFISFTDSCEPIIGEVPGMKNCYVATGHSCWGILNGPATGLAVSELVLDSDSAPTIADLSPFDPARFIRARNLQI